MEMATKGWNMSLDTFFAEGFCLRQVEHVSANNNNLNAKKRMSYSSTEKLSFSNLTLYWEGS